MIPIRAASADTSAFAYSRFRDEDLQYVYAALETAINFVGAVADNTLANTTNFNGRTQFDPQSAAEAVFEVTGCLHGLKTASDKVSDAISGYDDADEFQADEAEDPACDEAETDPLEPFRDHRSDAEARLLNAQAGLLELQFAARTAPMDNGVAVDLGELGWLNLIGDDKLIDFLIPRIREALGDYSTSKDADAHLVAPSGKLQEALRGLPRARRDAILKAVHGRGEAN